MKNRRNRLIPIILLLVIIVIAVTSCGSPSSTSIVGRWQHTQGEDQYMEFFSDGRIQLENAGNILTGTYELTGDDRISLIIEGMYEIDIEDPDAPETGVAVATYEIDGDVLTLSQGNEPSRFIRVK